MVANAELAAVPVDVAAADEEEEPTEEDVEIVIATPKLVMAVGEVDVEAVVAANTEVVDVVEEVDVEVVMLVVEVVVELVVVTSMEVDVVDVELDVEEVVVDVLASLAATHEHDATVVCDVDGGPINTKLPTTAPQVIAQSTTEKEDGASVNGVVVNVGVTNFDWYCALPWQPDALEIGEEEGGQEVGED
ncbi:hypothetical protein HK405_007836 [Cladochytrium tenue]|nr:hypothetical protein HK405_007836 [Cladochytrium tenue]